MADFEEWGYYIAQALGQDGNLFLEAYAENKEIANEIAVSSNPLAEAIISFMRDKDSFIGTATELFNKLNSTADKEKINVKHNDFPKSPNSLGKKLKEMKSNLEDIGISYQCPKTSVKVRLYYYLEGRLHEHFC